MQRELVDQKSFDPDEIDRMEDERVLRMDENGIDEEHILKQASEHMHIWMSYFNENITRGKDDMNFVLRDQWTAVERSEFTRLFKPAMTFNKLYDSTKKIAGEQRKNKPDLIVRSLTGKASEEQINLRADLVRTISYQSQNDLIYQTAFKSALMLGYGAFQVSLDYETSKSFNQTIKYELIPDATRTFFDPKAVKPHKGDGDFCGRSYNFSREEFFATYPYVDNPVSYIDPYMLLDFQWTTKDTITVCDYYVKEWYSLIIYKLSDGRVVEKEELEELKREFKKELEIAEGTEVSEIIEKTEPIVVNERQTQDYKIMHYRLIQNQIIDFSEWPSRYLPIIFVDGDSSYIEGRQYTKSFIHEARDAQKLLNYSRSELAAELKNRRREQWIGTPDNISGYEQDWRNPELQTAMLRAKPDPKTGQLPQKMPAWEISQGLFATSQSATQDIQEIMGFSENEALQGKDISGKARRERKLEGSMSAYVWFDNLNQAVEQGGRVVNDLLPFIVGDDERHMIISKKDGKTNSIILNKKMPNGQVSNKIELGDFDVEIDTGPSFAVQKDIALEFLQQTLQAFPQSFPLIADLWAKNLDVQFMPQISERFQSLVPPEILAKENGKPPPPPKQNPQEQMAQQEMQMKAADIQAKMKKIQIDQQKLELDKQKMIMDAQKLQEQMQLDHYNHAMDLRQAEIEHSGNMHMHDKDHKVDLLKIIADLKKDSNKSS